MANNSDEQDCSRSARGTVLCNRRVDGPYTVLPNSVVQGNLTPNAFRLLAYVASLPEDWELREAPARKACGLGRDPYYDALDELERQGFARHVLERESGRIKARWWEFTLTPGQFRELGPNLFLNFRKRHKSPFPEKPIQVKPIQANRTLQKTDNNKSNKRKNQQSDCSDFSSFGLSLSDGATPAGEASKRVLERAERKKGSARESLPEAWPFPDGHQTTKAVKRFGIEPHAVWEKFRAQALAGKVGNVKNIGGYLVTMARAMGKDAFGPPDPAALAKAREALKQRNARQPDRKAEAAMYERILAQEEEDTKAVRFKPGGYRGQTR